MSDWIRCFHPTPEAATRLLCFPHAGGSASAYHPFSAAVSGAVEPLVVQYPGRQDRHGEPFAERADEIVDAVLGALPQRPGDAPLALFGHSMGAVIAYETARRLTAEGRPPVALFVSGRQAPSMPQRYAGPRPARELTDAELLEDMRQLSGTADELLDDPDLLPLILPPMRADYQLLDDHVHREGPRLDCPVVVLTGESDPRVTLEGAQAWAQETRSASFDCHVLAGGHFFLDAHLPYISKVFAAALSRTETEDARVG
ncbi:thioesterase II family protein [Streptomyces sp. NPDC059002]|uniref:thioesterase II family protein n=1 Tax=Streptomyces sp. NPDC059002 TaxID=3346690 RepID=UPI0036AB79BF